MNTDNQKVSVVRCMHCDAPAVKEGGCCKACGKLLTGKEPAYLLVTPYRPGVKPLLQRWVVICGLVLAFSGFSPGRWMTILLVFVTAHYAIRIFKVMD